jgi:GNAT superfamily N-acetyltransferase
VLRLATAVDHPALRLLQRAFYQEEKLTYVAHVDAALQSLLSDAALGFALVDEEAGRVNAYLVVTFGFSLELGGKDAFVDELFVAGDARKRGVGRALMAQAANEARARGAKYLRLEVAEPDAGKLGFYQACGFSPRPMPLMMRPL